MRCPNCGTCEQMRVRVCGNCGEAFASQDLTELSQLEFLLDETGRWEVSESLRAPYVERLASLRVRLQRRAPAGPEVAREAVSESVAEREPEVEAVSVPAPELVTAKPERATESVAAPAVEPFAGPQPATRPKAAPLQDKVPFDQWLLSERNIKIALYSGGTLLVLAGIIFVGVNWARIPGPAKFAVTLMVTGLMYLAGYLLFQRRAYRIGGVALLAVASGFLALNFAVVQIYVLGPGGLRNDVMWLIASPLCLLLYALTAYWTRGDLFTYISLAAVVSTVTAALVVIDAPRLAFALSYSLLMWAALVTARAVQATRLVDFTRLPLLIVSHVGMPVVIVAAVVGWVFSTGSTRPPVGSPWLALLTLGVGVLFYVTTDVLLKWLAARWIAAVLFSVTFSLVLVELDFSSTAAGVTLMILALAQMGVGYVLEQREERRAGGWPLYATAYALALFVTLQAVSETDDLARVLFGDVALLALSAAIHRSYWWVYGAVWLLMLPIYLVISLFVPALHNQGLLMALLCLNYAAAGYALGRRQLGSGGPFLTAAAFLSLIVVLLTWGNPLLASLVLVSVAALYLLAALWLDWPWLLLPALLAVNLGALAVNRSVISGRLYATLSRALTISYAALGLALSLGGHSLRRAGQKRWVWPLYLVGVIDLAGAYVAGLIIGLWLSDEWLTIGVSAVLAAILLTYAWIERASFVGRRIPPVLTYLGIGVVFVGHFYVIGVAGGSRVWDVWSGYTAGLCALFVALAWFLRHEPLTSIYAAPLRRAGLWLMAVPMAGSAYIALVVRVPLVGAVTFAVAGVVYAVEAWLRRKLSLAYLSIGALVVVVWTVLMAFDVSEPQAYIVPLGLALLGIGWNERLRGRGVSYRTLTLLGLVVLMGSAFVQALPRRAYGYALLLAVESLAALGWGTRTRSRGYVTVGGLALIANAVAQFGPGFVELPRWVQIGVTGAILLGGGLAALFKREQILSARQRLAEEWRRWEP